MLPILWQRPLLRRSLRLQLVPLNIYGHLFFHTASRGNNNAAVRDPKPVRRKSPRKSPRIGKALSKAARGGSQRGQDPAAVSAMASVLSRLHKNHNTYVSDESLQKLHELWPSFQGRIPLDGYYKTWSAPVASVLVQHFVIDGKYSAALQVIQRLHDSGSGARVDMFAVCLLAYYLVQQNQYQLMLKLMLLLNSAHYSFTLPQQLVSQWLACLFASPKADADGSLRRRFCTGSTPPLLETYSSVVTYGELLEMAQLFAREHSLSAFGAVVAHTVDHMRAENLPSSRISDYRHQMTLLRFSSYVASLGATSVIANGMFHRLGSKKNFVWKVADLSQLVNSLAKEYPQIDYNTAVKLIDQMHGYHVKECTSRYSPLLHPDVQMKRVLNHRPDNDGMSQEELDRIRSKLRNNPAAGFGTPEKMSEKFRNSATVTSGKKYHPLPLNVILRLISETSNDVSLAVTLVKFMVKKHSMTIDQETMLHLVRILGGQAPDPGVATQLVQLYQGFKRFIQLNRQLHEEIIYVLVASKDQKLLYYFLDLYKKQGFPISHRLYDAVLPILDEEQAQQFSPTLSPL